MVSRYTPKEIEARFWARVLKKGSDDCWEWLGCLTGAGYGHFVINGKTIGAHRFSYQLHIGSVADLWVLHTCDNPKCVNPNHLFLGTQFDNMRDMVKKGRGYVPDNRVLTQEQVNEIRIKYIPRIYTSYELAKEYNVSQHVIMNVINYEGGY